MEDPIQDRDVWYREKVDFVSSVVSNVDIAFIRDQVMGCQNNKDVEILIQYLLEDGSGGDPKFDVPRGAALSDFGVYNPSAPNLSDEEPLGEPPDGYHEPARTRGGIRSEGAVPKERPRAYKEEEAHHTTQEQSEEEVEARVMEQVVSLAEIFTDADPDYLQKRCWEIKGNPDRFLSVVQQMLRDRDYPKMDSYLERQKERDIQRTFESMSVQEYLAFVGDMHEEEQETAERECEICYTNVPVGDMVSCSGGRSQHRFCENCIKRFAEEEIGQGRFTFRCPQIDCPGSIREQDLSPLLAPGVMDRVMQKQQQEEVDKAGIEDLESCPFCDFKIIMPNKYDRVFLCQNPLCMKDSCRLCKEENHIPLSCREVLAEKQKDVRTTLENRMAEAMIRECVKCKKRFILETGCNKMKCPCGALMCYLCKKPIDGYSHFTQYPDREPDKCPLWSNSNSVHGNEVRQAATQARQELAPDVDLVHDPTADLDNI